MVPVPAVLGAVSAVLGAVVCVGDVIGALVLGCVHGCLLLLIPLGGIWANTEPVGGIPDAQVVADRGDKMDR